MGGGRRRLRLLYNNKSNDKVTYITPLSLRRARAPVNA